MNYRWAFYLISAVLVVLGGWLLVRSVRRRGGGELVTPPLVLGVVLLLIGMTTAAKVIAYDAAEATAGQAGATPAPPIMSGLNGPTGIAASGGGLYVCDNGDSASPTESTTALPATPRPPRSAGRLLKKGSSRDLTLRTLNEPVGLIVDSSGNVYVTDHDTAGTSGRLWMFTLQHPAYEPDINVNGVRPILTLAGPGGVAVDSGGNIYVAEPPSGKVLRLAAGAKTASEFFQAPDGGSVGDVAVDGDNLYVTDSKNSRLYKVSISGGAAPTQVPTNFLSHPQGLTVDSSGNLYVVDAGNRRVVKFARDLNNGVELPFSGLDKPFDVAVDDQGHTFVTDQGKGLVFEIGPQS